MKHLLFLVSLLLSSTAFASSEWGYEKGEADPEHWAKLSPEFAACSGQNQSPINIEGTLKAALEPLSVRYTAGGETLTNNGHTVQVTYAPGSTLHIDGQDFTLKQFHFHAPSENLIHGQSFPLEAHFVHMNDKGELAVLALMFKEGDAAPLLTETWEQVPHKVGETITFKAPLNAATLLPSKLDYYRFSGSLTTPPCSEGVRWLVLKEPMTASKAQIDAFKAIMHHANNRPVQPLGARQVLE